MMKAAAIDCPVSPMDEPFGDGARCPGRLLQSLAGKSAAEMQPRQGRAWTDYRVLVKAIVLVMACPCAPGANGLEWPHPRRQRRPDHLVEQMPVRLEIIGGGRFLVLVGLCPAGDEHPAFRAH